MGGGARRIKSSKLFSENREFGNSLGYMRPCFINISIIVNKVVCLRMWKREIKCVVASFSMNHLFLPSWTEVRYEFPLTNLHSVLGVKTLLQKVL